MADEALAGAEAYNQRTAGLEQEMMNWRKDKAMNALTSIYGPVAGDPEDAQKLQNYLTTTQQDPLKTQALSLGNTAQDLANQGAVVTNRTAAAGADTGAAMRAAMLLKGQVAPDGSIPQSAIDQVVTPENLSLFGADPAHAPQLKAILGSAHGGAALDHIIQGLGVGAKTIGSPVTGIGPDGQPIMTVMTQYGPREYHLDGTPVPVLNAETARAGIPIRQQNANTSAFNAGTRANNTEFGGPGGAVAPGAPAITPPPAAAAPVDRTPTLPTDLPGSAAAANLLKKYGGNFDTAVQHIEDIPPAGRKNVLDVFSAAARGSMVPGERAGAPTPVAAAAAALPPLPPKGQQMRAADAQALANQGTFLNSTHSILDQVTQQIGPYTSGAYARLADLPGTAATDLKANLATLKAQGLTAWITSLKNSQGQTGIGRVLQSEANAAMSLLGNMEQDQSPAQLAYHTRLFKTTLDQLYQHAQAGYKAKWGVDPNAVLGPSPTAPGSKPAAPPPGLKLPPGFKYIGPAP